jgi:hypothetical protein
MTPDLSLLRCDDCGFVTGDVCRSRYDKQDRCGPCDRRADHARRLATGDGWYLSKIREFAGRYGRDDFADACALFADTRALGGWAAVGVELPPRRARAAATRPCPVCGETTSSASAHFCAACHFRGWWSRWDDNEVER